MPNHRQWKNAEGILSHRQWEFTHTHTESHRQWKFTHTGGGSEAEGPEAEGPEAEGSEVQAGQKV